MYKSLFFRSKNNELIIENIIFVQNFNIDDRNMVIGNFINWTEIVAQTEALKNDGMEDAFIILGKQSEEEGNCIQWKINL
uniref:Uncharacterized protein n=1 Tax=Strongyloides venezuelensis TaxID=75913 RepID=A0A0K0F393_STRVS